jgi:membrane associated rhomboid family serine protease
LFPLRDSVPSRRFPFINLGLIALNLFVFFKEVHLSYIGNFDAFLMTYGLVPARFFADPFTGFPSIFTAMFLHGGWGHVLGNMWFLYIFGDNVEDVIGHFRYLIYYLLMGVGAAMAQLYANPLSQLPMVGASGAIAGILGSYFVLNPGAKVLTAVWIFFFIRLVEIPAFFFLGLWFFMQMVNGLGSLSTIAVRGDKGGVAWWAHAGGFVSGFVLIWFFRRSRSR